VYADATLFQPLGMTDFEWVGDIGGHHYQHASRLDARIHLHAKYSTNPQGFHAWVFEHLHLSPTCRCRVLEVGCGSGRLWQENQHRIPAGWDLTLSDCRWLF